MTTFVWKIPSLHHHQKELVCHGYIRENCSKYIIDPLISIFAEYYNPESFTLEDIKNAANLQLFVSPIFTFDSCPYSTKWFLELHPNGSNQQNKGSVILYLCLAMIPPKIDKVSASYTLSLQETNAKFSEVHTFERKDWYIGWLRDVLKFEDIQDLDQLTFTVDLNVIATTDLDKNRYHRVNPMKHSQILPSIDTVPITYKYEITDILTVDKIHNAKKSEHFNGPIMSYGPYKYFLQFRPKHYKTQKPWIGFSIWYWPTNIVQCLCKINIIFNELNVSKSGYKLFEAKHLGFAWSTRLTEDEMQQFNQLKHYSFYVDVSIIDIIYDDDTKEDMTTSDGMEIAAQHNIFSPVAINKLPHFEYEWKISNNKQLTELKNASNVFAFVSPIFEAYSLKWYISLWPNGSRTSRQNSVNIFLVLASMKSTTLRIPIIFEIEWVESGKICCKYDTFAIQHGCGGEITWPLQTMDIQSLNTFTVKARVWIGDMIDDDECVADKYIDKYNENIVKPRNIPLPSQTFEWKIASLIDEKRINESVIFYQSETFTMYGMDFSVLFYPNGHEDKLKGHTVLFIKLAELPSITTLVSIRYTIFNKETNTRYTGETTFHQNNMRSTWDHERISTETFRNLDVFTIQLDMELIDVYDNNYRITNKFLPKGYYDQLKQQKNGNVEILRLEMDELDQIIHQLTILNGNSNRDECVDNDYKNNLEQMDELKNWLFNIVQMPQYYKTFVFAGINEISMVKLLNKDILTEIGIWDTQNISRLLIEIAMLNISD